jgi:uncharacterized membrane protein required for colicin V production
VDIVGIIRGAPIADLVIFAALFLAFIIGVMQGAIRRVLGIASILFAFLAAANLRSTVGDFLSSNWQQFPEGYNDMLAFFIVFMVLTIAFSIAIQGLYKRTEIYAARPIVDEVVGGFLGLLEGLVVLLVIVIIANSYQMPDQFPGELDYVRQVHDAIVHQSHIAGAIKDGVASPLVHLLAAMLPGDVVAAF